MSTYYLRVIFYQGDVGFIFMKKKKIHNIITNHVETVYITFCGRLLIKTRYHHVLFVCPTLHRIAKLNKRTIFNVFNKNQYKIRFVGTYVYTDLYFVGVDQTHAGVAYGLSNLFVTPAEESNGKIKKKFNYGMFSLNRQNHKML